jgi:hypothetical protein
MTLTSIGVKWYGGIERNGEVSETVDVKTIIFCILFLLNIKRTSAL